LFNDKSVVKKLRVYATANDPVHYSKFINSGGISWWEAFYIFGVNLQF